MLPSPPPPPPPPPPRLPSGWSRRLAATGPGGRGAWCFCKSASGSRVASAVGTTPAFGTCLHGEGFPSQINLQIAAPKTVVVSFVTFEPTVPAGTPMAYIGTSAAELTQATGAAVTHALPLVPLLPLSFSFSFSLSCSRRRRVPRRASARASLGSPVALVRVNWLLSRPVLGEVKTGARGGRV